MSESRPVCDYEGSNYRTRFWDGQGRDYENQVERIALRRLMAPAGANLIDIGAGFGRLADEFGGYQQVVLFDYSRSLLREAQTRLGHDSRFLFVAGNWYKMPFVAGLFETMVQVRTIHHAQDVPALFAQLARIARPGGHYILEFANKRNLKAMVRYGLGRQKWSPFTPEPVEFAPLNFDFQRQWMGQQLAQAGFRPGRVLTVSNFRLELLKKIVPISWLVGLDRLLQPAGRWWQLSPSLFVHNHHPQQGQMARPGTFFACPECQTPLGPIQDNQLNCDGCGRRWAIRDGLYDFKEPIGHAQ